MSRNRNPMLSRIFLAVIILAASGTAALPIDETGFRPNGGSGGTRGENPVVGSLPCVVTPSLNEVFWKPLGLPKPYRELEHVPPIFGMIGPPEFDGAIIDAHGTPYGGLNYEEAWTCFALAAKGTVYFSRYALEADDPMIEIWQYVPEDYVGGTLTVQESSGTRTIAITDNLVDLPVDEILSAPGAGTARLSLTPKPGKLAWGDKVVIVSFNDLVVEVRYQP